MVRKVSATPLIEFDHVSKIFGQGESEVRALDRVNLQIEAGEFVAVMGPSGSGKSTSMNIIGCLDVPSAGQYRFMGLDVGALSRDGRALLRQHYLGFVFQGFNLLPRTSALENVEMPLTYRGLPPRERREAAMNALEKVGLGPRAHHMPSELSGGQQQRVAIARAIVTEPKLLVADEPTGNLDTRTSVEIMELLSGLSKLGITIVMVTHEPDMAVYAHREIHFLDGHIKADQKKGSRA